VFTQTEPQCARTVFTQTSSFQELRDTWKKEYALSQEKILQEHKSLWLNHVYRNWEVLEHSRAQHKENKELKTRLSLIFELVQRLLATRKPSFNYSVFLRERLAFLQVKAIRDGRPHEVSAPSSLFRLLQKHQLANIICYVNSIFIMRPCLKIGSLI